MNYSMGSGIIRYIRASKTFSKFRAFRSSVRFEVPCGHLKIPLIVGSTNRKFLTPRC